MKQGSLRMQEIHTGDLIMCLKEMLLRHSSQFSFKEQTRSKLNLIDYIRTVTPRILMEFAVKRCRQYKVIDKQLRKLAAIWGYKLFSE